MKRDDYIMKLMKTIKNRSVKKDIQSEIQDCIEDMTEMYVNQGMSKEESEAEAVRQMGDPVEAGEMFNVVYRPKFEWKASWYMLIWILITIGIKFMLAFSDSLFYESDLMMEYEGLTVLTTLLGIMFLIPGMCLSYVEKCNDLPFTWWKKAPSKHWRIPGLGVFGNASAICGIAIGLMSKNITQLICLYGFITVVMLLQRIYITQELSKKEQQYIYRECVALKDFNFRGPVYIGTEKHKVQLVRGETAKKGDRLMVVQMDGFMLVVEKM